MEVCEEWEKVVAWPCVKFASLFTLCAGILKKKIFFERESKEGGAERES